MQTLLYPPEAPRIKERRYPAASASLDSYKQTDIDAWSPSPWVPGERDRYRPVCPPGYVDACPIEASPSELRWRHASWWNTRTKVMASMVRANLPPARLARFSNCGGGAFVYQDPKTGSCEVSAAYCGDRLCHACSRARSATIAAQLAATIKGREVRHVVLTLRHSPMPLRDQIDRLYTCFANLRRHKYWKRKVVGGAAFCEIKIGKAGRWHVHLHCILEGGFFPHAALSAAWLVATGDSDIVWVGRVPEAGRLAGYVAKYVTKAIDQSVIDSGEKLDEAVLALRGKRMCLTFGNWRGIDLRPATAPKEGWKMIGRLDGLIRAAASGCLWSSGILAGLKNGSSGHGSNETGVQPCGPPNRDG